MSKNNYNIIDQEGQKLSTNSVRLHPGFIVEEEIEARNLKKGDVAIGLKIKPQHLSELFKGKRNISATLAIRLERYFGIDAEYWLRVQSRYDLANARIKMKE